MRELTFDEIDMVSGGLTGSDGIAVGGAIIAVGLGAVALASTPVIAAAIGTTAVGVAIWGGSATAVIGAGFTAVSVVTTLVGAGGNASNGGDLGLKSA